MSGWIRRWLGAGGTPVGANRASTTDPATASAAIDRDAPFAATEALSALDAGERERLGALAAEFVATRRFDAAGGLEIDEAMRVRVAVEACLPVLELGLERYREARTVLLYPGGFRVAQRWTDEVGVEHERDAELVGEAWEGGPVILAWEDVVDPEPGTSVVIHEFAHVLDAQNGRTNGFPPLADAAAARRWTRVFSAAYAAHGARVARGEDAFLDDYAAEDEGEFFAVAVETFFTWPENVAEGYPEVYEVLREFFRQDPLARLERAGTGKR